MSVQQRVADYVENNGIKQAFIVEKTGLTRNVVSAILKSKRKMTVDELELFCRALNQKPSSFIIIGSKEEEG